MKNDRKIVVAVTGASGAIYAKLLFEKLNKLSKQIDEIAIVFSKNASEIWKYELGDVSYKEIPFTIYKKDDFYAPMASGSSGFDTMIICPCSMGALGKIAGGISDDLISRSADVILKEKRKLILVTREAPLNLIHIRNMKIITKSGGIICPASPSFYSKPSTIEQLVETVVDRVLQLADFTIKTYRWGKSV